MSFKFRKMLSIRNSLSWEVIVVGPSKFGVNHCLFTRSRNSLTSVLVSYFKIFNLKSPVDITFLLSLVTLFKALFRYLRECFSIFLHVFSLHQTKCFVLRVHGLLNFYGLIYCFFKEKIVGRIFFL